jgi:hypothetical protein|tara:strand:- start:175 stop:393 length:219 start_codon:yes stop_codon:yes gene_type:complete
METLDLYNVFEIQKIRSMLIHHPDLLSMFELLIIVSNKRLNEEKTIVNNLPIEPNEEPDLSSDSEDDNLLDE